METIVENPNSSNNLGGLYPILIKEAEARSALFVLKAVKERRVKKGILCLADLEVAKAIRGVFDWKIHHIICDILACIKDFVFVKAIHIPRDILD